MTDPREQSRAAILEDVDQVLQSARDAGHNRVLLTALQLKSKILGILDDAPPEPPDDSTLPDDPLDAQLFKIRRLLSKAEADRSWVAARGLMAEERACLDAIAERDRHNAEAARLAAGDGEMFDRFAGDLEELADGVVERLAGLCAERLGR